MISDKRLKLAEFSGWKRKAKGPLKWVKKLFLVHVKDQKILGLFCITIYVLSQCPRTDLGKRFLPKPMTTTG